MRLSTKLFIIFPFCPFFTFLICDYIRIDLLFYILAYLSVFPLIAGLIIRDEEKLEMNRKEYEEWERTKNLTMG